MINVRNALDIGNLMGQPKAASLEQAGQADAATSQLRG